MSTLFLSKISRSHVLKQLFSERFPALVVGQSRGKASRIRPFNNKKKILYVTSAVVQNKNGINELPIIIRRVGNEVFEYGNKYMKETSDESKALAKSLYACSNVQEVLKLLEIPRREVSGLAASSALLKLYNFERQTANLLGSLVSESFLSKAIMEELFQVVAKDFETVKSADLIDLVDGYLNVVEYTDHVLRLAEKRIADGHFSVTELLSLSDVLLRSMREYRTMEKSVDDHIDLLQKVWVHLISKDINSTNILEILEKFPIQMKKDILRPLMLHIENFGWQLCGHEIAAILFHMIRLRERNMKILKDMGDCTIRTIHSVEPKDLSIIIAAFQYYSVYYEPFFKVLEKYITLKQTKIHIPLLSQILKFFKDFRYFSPTSLDTAATVFISKGVHFTHEELHNILTSFGYFNHLPESGRKFLMVVEPVLFREAYSLDALMFLEILCSFCYLNCKVHNFLRIITSSQFIQRISELEMSRKAMALELRGRISSQFSFSFYYDRKMFVINPLLWQQGEDNARKSVKFHLQRILMSIWDVSWQDVTKHARFNFYVQMLFVECAVGLGQDDMAIGDKLSLHSNRKKALILVNYPEHQCINTKHLLGEESYRRRSLASTECKIVTLLYEEMHDRKSWQETLERELAFMKDVINNRGTNLWA